MRIFSLLVFTTVLMFSSCDSNSSDHTDQEVKPSIDSVNESTELLRHVVLFQFNEDATEEIVKEIESKFAALPEQISEIHSFEWGLNNSPEGLNKGLTHCFFVTFLTEEAREIYLPHPAHQEFVDFIGPYVKDVTVIDYWAN